MSQAHVHLEQVREEQAQAEAAGAFLDAWAKGRTILPAVERPLQIRDAARLLGLTPDVLRNWERNGLIKVPRNPHNRYRLYGAAEIGRLQVIRMLRSAGYSIMAVLRMVLQLDQGQREDLRQVLDSPRPDEDVYSATDQWLSTLGALEQRALEIAAQIKKLEKMISRQVTPLHRVSPVKETRF